jgi:hypothetical protein
MKNNATDKYIPRKNFERINNLNKQVFDIKKATKKEIEKRKKEPKYKEYEEKNNQSWEKRNNSLKSGRMVREYKYEPPPVYYEKDERRIYKVMPNQGIMSNLSTSDVMTTSSLNKATHKELYPLRKFVYDKTKMVASENTRAPPRDEPSKLDEPSKFHAKKKMEVEKHVAKEKLAKEIREK